jgi:putative ABC transport system permease protein
VTITCLRSLDRCTFWVSKGPQQAADGVRFTRNRRTTTRAAISSLALLLSAVGIFALVANIVAQRTREIGIRMALGSTIGKTMIQVGRTGVGASAMGLALGLILCVGVLPAMRSVLYGVGVYDAPTMLAVVLTLCAVTLLATTPILRVASIDPAKTLREE